MVYKMSHKERGYYREGDLDVPVGLPTPPTVRGWENVMSEYDHETGLSEQDEKDLWMDFYTMFTSPEHQIARKRQAFFDFFKNLEYFKNPINRTALDATRNVLEIKDGSVEATTKTYVPHLRPENIERKRDVFAISDIHGDPDALHRSLLEMGLIDSEWNWIGGDSAVVFCGDYIGRGWRGLEVLARLNQLKPNVLRAGGIFKMLIGNHENTLLNFLTYGTYKYHERREPTEEEAAFGRTTSWKECDTLEDYTDPEEGRDGYALMQEFGKLVYREVSWDETASFILSGYRDLLLGMDIMCKIDDTLFVHAGIAPEWARMISMYGVEHVNDVWRQSMEDLKRGSNYGVYYFGKSGGSRARRSKKWDIFPSCPPEERDDIWVGRPKVDADGVESIEPFSKGPMFGGPLWFDHKTDNRHMTTGMYYQVATDMHAAGVRTIVCGHTINSYPQFYKELHDFGLDVVDIDIRMSYGYGSRSTGRGGIRLGADGCVSVFQYLNEFEDSDYTVLRSPRDHKVFPSIRYSPPKVAEVKEQGAAEVNSEQMTVDSEAAEGRADVDVAPPKKRPFRPGLRFMKFLGLR